MRKQTKKYLIVNADDFGLSLGVNRGIIEAHEHGIVTSASLMVNWPGAIEAASYGWQHPELSLGLHLDFGEWAFRDEEWVPLYEKVSLDDAAAIAEEADRQLASFKFFANRNPTHLDSHQHVHLHEPARSVIIAMAKRLSVPLRSCSSKIHYCGDFYGQTAEGEPYPAPISVEGLINILEKLPPGTTELCTHPGYDDGLNTMYTQERAVEVQTLCDPRIRIALEQLGIELRSFGRIA
jgi:predicted glycoside hydrolase/deacetylase ChbG (UPF0249 family)